MKEYIYLLLMRTLNFIFPLARNKVLFMSYYGRQYGCSPKYLSEYLVSNCSGMDVVWVFTRPEQYDIPGVRKVRYLSFRYFYELCTCKVLVTNYRMTSLFLKRKNQYYIQTWHSSLRLKQIEKDAEETLPSSYMQMAKVDSEKIDFLISGCSYSTSIFRRAFWYDGAILESGTPRNDLFFHKNKAIKGKVCKSLNISSSTHFVLYAPTFRKGNTLEFYDVDFRRVVETLSAQIEGEWKVMLRLHPHLYQYSQELLKNYPEVIDVTSYDDIQELLYVADVLITDYSSLMFDFALTERPCFLYVKDLEAYVQSDRKLYFDIDQLPFPKCLDNEELIQNIVSFNNEEYLRRIQYFLKKVGSFEDGHSSKRIVNKIFNNLIFKAK